MKSNPLIRRSTGVVLLVGVLAGITVGGGVGVIAASSTKTVTVCANKKTNVLRYAKNGKCETKTETKVTLNQTGAAGAAGAKGDSGAAGAAGAKGDSGAAGAAGAKGDSGAAGAAGAKGDAGTAGVNATGAITQLSVCDGSDVDTVANELCKIGMTGPGRGIIFFVDYNDQYAGLNYLEAAPVGWGNGLLNVNLGGLSGETAGTTTVDPLMNWCSNTSSSMGLNAWANSAVGAGASNTSTAVAMCTGGAIKAAVDYRGGSKSDWFLPSVGEAMLMYTNLRPGSLGGFSSDGYWSSSETDASNGYAWIQSFYSGSQGYGSKSYPSWVRPVRAF